MPAAEPPAGGTTAGGDSGGAGRKHVLEAARALLPAGADPSAMEVAAETVADATVDAERRPGEVVHGLHSHAAETNAGRYRAQCTKTK